MSPRTTKTTADLVAASILLAAMAAVTACSASPSPNPSPPAAPTAAQTSTGTSLAASTPTATPSPTATWPPQMTLPTPPPEMSRDDEAGAVAAATYFLTDLYPYTVISHDTTEWLEMSHSLCVYCQSISSAVMVEKDAQGATTPGEVSVVATRSETFSALAFGVKLDLHIGPTVKRTSSGVVVGERPAADATMAAVVVWQTDRWLIRGVDVLPFGTGA